METLVTTYLEMRSPNELRKPARELSAEQLEVRELIAPNWSFNREMYFKVGEPWRWIDKRPWTDEQWRDYATDPNLRTYAGYANGKLAGYYELHRSPEDGTEIAYFGLLPEFVGRGIGSALLTSAVENAWRWEPAPSRVWVHTCNRDHPHALANYAARGFEIYKIEREAPSSRVASDFV